jgi:hypothetical protein
VALRSGAPVTVNLKVSHHGSETPQERLQPLMRTRPWTWRAGSRRVCTDTYGCGNNEQARGRGALPYTQATHFFQLISVSPHGNFPN